MWSDLVWQEYQLDDDEMKSALKLLERGENAGGLGNYMMEAIPLPDIDRFKALAWSLPDMLQKWGGRI